MSNSNSMNWSMIAAVVAGVLGTNGYIATSNTRGIGEARELARESRDMTEREMEVAGGERASLQSEIVRLQSELEQTRAKLGGVAPELKALADTLSRLRIDSGCGEGVVEDGGGD